MRDSTQITTTFSYTPPAFLQSKKELVQRGPEPEYDVARFPNSSKKDHVLRRSYE